MEIAESIEQKLEQNEKIIQICSESLPHLSSAKSLTPSKNFKSNTNEISSNVNNKNKINTTANSLNNSSDNIVINPITLYFLC